MYRANRVSLIILAAIMTAFLFGVIHLFLLNLESGDVYPPYSSFRSDPLGIRAFYGALESLPQVTVRRNIEPLFDIGDGRDKTLMICGASQSADPEDLIKALEDFAAAGGRIVITFYPLNRGPDIDGEDEEGTDEKECSGKGCPTPTDEDEEKEDEDEMEPGEVNWVSIDEQWGFQYGYRKLPRDENNKIKKVHARREAQIFNLPPALSWHSSLFFNEMDEKWKVIYARDDNAVIMERPWINGTIALCGDSYFLSNEAMRRERHPELLAWIVGESSTVIFDESHLGVQARPGVMTLIRKYRLTWTLASLLLLAALFIWKNTATLTPKKDILGAEAGPTGHGKDSASGLVNILRRSISSADALSVCVDEWEAAFTRDTKLKKDQHGRIRALANREKALPPRERNPIGAYRKICQILKERG